MSGLYYSKAAYCEASVIDSWSCGVSCEFHSGFEIQGVYNLYSNASYGAQGYTGFSPSENMIVVAFRGSANIENWIADLDFKKMVYPNSNCQGCEVHTGFYQVYLEMADAVLRDVQALVRSHPNVPVFVTGHSLGAAVSLHAAVDIVGKISGYSTLTVYNFGEPRVGNPAFAAWASSVLPGGHQFRVTHSRDPVPHVPPMDFGFLHSPHELWYDNNGDSSFQNCQDSASAEDPNCSDSLIPFGISDHLLYLGICTECSCSSFDATRYAKRVHFKNGYEFSKLH